MTSDEAIFALIEAMGMHAENQQRAHNGYSMAYTYDAFMGIIKDAQEQIKQARG